MALDGSYLDRSELKARRRAPGLHDGAFIDPTGTWTDPNKIAERDQWFAFIESTLQEQTSKINSRLRKRYDAPFAAPYPAVVLGWLAAKVMPLLYLGRGIDASDQQYVDMVALAKEADDEIKEAADSETGLFELPLRQDQQTSAITQGGPFSYSEADPYAWTDVQREAMS